MAGKTQQQRLIEALTAQGLAVSVPEKSKKYATMKPTTPTFSDDLYFIGKAGSLRYGRTYTTSYPVRDNFKSHLIRYSIRADAVATSVE